MYQEVKTVILIYLIFFVYGLTSYFSLGDFVTPFFFSKIILILVSLYFFVKNISIKKSYYLLLAFLAMLSAAIVDDFTVGFVGQLTSSTWLEKLSYNPTVIYISFFLFYGFLYLSIFILHKKVKRKFFTVFFITLLTLNVLLIYLKFYILQEITINVFFITYFFLINKSKSTEKSLLSILSALFLLIVLLNSLKYLFLMGMVI